VRVMIVRGRVWPAFAVVVLAALAACGGGGGGGSIPGGGGGGGGGPTPTPTPATGTGYVPPTGAVTLMSATVNGQFGSALLPASADGVMTAEVATTPTVPPSGGGAFPQYTVTVKETAGVGTSSASRSPESVRALQALIAQSRKDLAVDGLRERPSDVAATRNLFRALSATRTTAGVRRTHAAPGNVGTQRPFKIQTSNIGNSGGCAGGGTSGTYVCNVTITATLEAVGAHANVWVDNASLNTLGEFTNVPAEFQTIASKFDGYYNIETAAFGAAFYPGAQPLTYVWDSSTNGKKQCDSSGNPLPPSSFLTVDLSGSNGTSIDVVITDALAGTGEGGYYAGTDEIPQQVWDCAPSPRRVSNYTSMFVITGNNYAGLGNGVPPHNESFWLNTDVPRSMAHELQHLIHAHYKAFRPVATGTGSGSFDDAFVEEGCSMLAEDLATDPSPGQHLDTPRYSYVYLLEPSLFSLTAFTGFQPNPSSNATNPPYGFYSNTGGSYGQAYLFMRYIYDRFGPSALTTIYNTPGPGVAPVLAAAGGESFPQLYREFASAVSAQSSPLATAPYAFSSAVVLRGNVDVPSARLAPLNTRHYVFGGPQAPETFNNNQPSGFLTLGPGTTATTFILEGGILYLPSSNGPSGNSINLTIPGAPSLEGSLIQGALPTPPPSSS
jgi:hypothetical protein